MSIGLVIPARNPNEHLTRLIQEVRVLIPQIRIIIVDHGSDELSAALFDKIKYSLKCNVARHPESYGKGAAIKTAMGYIDRFRMGLTGFIAADADGGHSAADILGVYETMCKFPHHIILGVYSDITDKGQPVIRIRPALAGAFDFGNRLVLLGIPIIHTNWAGQIPSDRFEYTVNLVLRARDLQIPTQETVVETPCRNQARPSAFRFVRDTARICAAVLRHYTGRLFRRKTCKPAGATQGVSPSDREPIE